jgi:hypothetical protein
MDKDSSIVSVDVEENQNTGHKKTGGDLVNLLSCINSIKISQ